MRASKCSSGVCSPRINFSTGTRFDALVGLLAAFCRPEEPAIGFLHGPSEESGLHDAEHVDGGQAQHFILAASSQTATAGAIAPVLSESSPADGLVDSIAKLTRLRGLAGFRDARLL